MDTMKTTQRRRFNTTFMVISLIALIFTAGSFRLSRAEAQTNDPKKIVEHGNLPFIVLGMGCFWGAERRMQRLHGVVDVESGYAGGDIANPRYETLHETEEAIHKGQAVTNHAEVVKVYYDPEQTSLERVLIQFWENHDPTQTNRQGADIGSNYRSAIFYRTEDEKQLAIKTREAYQKDLRAGGLSAPISTEIAPLKNFTTAEAYHQDYLIKNPNGYCGLGGTGIHYSASLVP